MLIRCRNELRVSFFSGLDVKVVVKVNKYNDPRPSVFMRFGFSRHHVLTRPDVASP